MIFRKGNINDLENLQKLFVDTINEVCKNDYDSKQISVWTSSVENKTRWQDILKNQFVLVAEKNNQIIGFATLKNGNYLDLIYIHKDFQRQGIASKLYEKIEKEAKQKFQNNLTSDVSKTAKLFFEKNGFKLIKEQNLKIKNVKLINYKMTKSINLS